MLDARRKAGDTLIEMKERGELETKGGDRKSKLEHPTLKLDDLGISKYQASHYQLEARVSEEKSGLSRAVVER